LACLRGDVSAGVTVQVFSVGIEIRHLLFWSISIHKCMSQHTQTRQWLRNDGRESRRGIWGIVYVPRLLSGRTRIATRTLEVGPSRGSCAVELIDREDMGVLGLEAIVLDGLDAIIFGLWRLSSVF